MTNNTQLLPCPFCGVAALATDGMFGNVINCDHLHTCPLDGYEKFAAAISEWNTRAAPAEDVRAVVEEPVSAYQAEIVSLKVRLAERDKLIDHIALMIRKSQAPNQAPQRPVVLPERKPKTELGIYSLEDEGYNACLDDIARLSK